MRKPYHAVQKKAHFVFHTGLLVLPGLQASGWSEGLSCPCGWAAEEAPTRASHTRQATHLRTLYQLRQVRIIVSLFDFV